MKKNKPKKPWTRSKDFDNHHMTPKQRGGSSVEYNLLYMNKRRHQALHLLFNNLTWNEIEELVHRVRMIKEKKRAEFYRKIDE